LAAGAGAKARDVNCTRACEYLWQPMFLVELPVVMTNTTRLDIPQLLLAHAEVMS
jgi:hypothetical protein